MVKSPAVRVFMVSERWAIAGKPHSGSQAKKSCRFRRLVKLITGRRQTEWTGATRCPNEDADSHKRESLMNRKERNFFQTSLAMSANGRANGSNGAMKKIK